MTSTTPIAPNHVDANGWRDLVRRIPTAWKTAVVVAALGWAFRFTWSTKTSINGVVDCDGFDAGPFIVGALLVTLVAVGFATMRSKHVAQRLNGNARWVVAGALAAAAAAYLISGLVDPAGAAC
ncbi:hypothetical protein [Desertimonas flava]|uniref:hypothetical protein n=1 Tax=Desertimonas flava TaxID=2064846 RepID=UPI000E346740|nr:hypothetical protein [Desertimonas flava]